MTPSEFLLQAVAAARAAEHIFPEYAACEAALESGWGSSTLARQGNNLFGQKQSHPPSGNSLSLPTREFVEGKWVVVPAQWKAFPDWQACFGERMALLRESAAICPHYRAALLAKTGAEFIVQVSASWSTDPQRANKVLRVFGEHFSLQAATTLQSA